MNEKELRLLMNYKEQQRLAERDRIWIRKGYCSRCGDCCWEFERNKKLSALTKTTPCKHLVFNDDGTTSCSIYENRHESCKDFPLSKYSMNDIKYFKNCTYYWELDISLTVEEALKRHKRTCKRCANKDKEECENRKNTVKLIKEKCKK